MIISFPVVVDPPAESETKEQNNTDVPKAVQHKRRGSWLAKIADAVHGIFVDEEMKRVMDEYQNNIKEHQEEEKKEEARCYSL